MLNLDPEQLRVLRHMLGIDRPDVAKPEPYRDYYCANPGDPDLVELARVGAVRLYDTRGGYEWYTCTDEGRAAAIASHKTIRYSPAKLRYSQYLDLKDCCPDLTFRQFLTDPRFMSDSNAGVQRVD
jgi:hypothetical protein